MLSSAVKTQAIVFFVISLHFNTELRTSELFVVNIAAANSFM